MCGGLQVLAALADNAKHNQVGRVEEHGALRHRYMKVCAVGAVAMLFFAQFHILNRHLPNFEPDFQNPEFGEWGSREWYRYHVFWTKSELERMSYESEPSPPLWGLWSLLTFILVLQITVIG